MSDHEAAVECVAYVIEIQKAEAERDYVPEVEFVTKAIADARAAGYAEAIEKAAKVAESRGGMPYYGRGRPGTPPAYSSAIATADAIRALAPATTKEPT